MSLFLGISGCKETAILYLENIPEASHYFVWVILADSVFVSKFESYLALLVRLFVSFRPGEPIRIQQGSQADRAKMDSEVNITTNDNLQMFPLLSCY